MKTYRVYISNITVTVYEITNEKALQVFSNYEHSKKREYDIRALASPDKWNEKPHQRCITLEAGTLEDVMRECFIDLL